MQKDIFTKYARLLSLDKSTFPNKPGKIKSFLYLRSLDLLMNFRRKHFFGPFGRGVDPFVLFAWKLFSKYNPFHFSVNTVKGNYFGLDYFEYRVVKEFLSLYKADTGKITGMLLSGATEGNLYSMWLARESFYSKGIKNVFVVLTELSDISVVKSANLLNLPMLKVGLTEKFGMSEIDLESEVSKIGKGSRKVGLIVCLTMGYKKSGTSDNYEIMINMLNSLRIRYRNVGFSVFIDAASEGFIKPLVENFKPFNDPLVKSLVFDSHKLFFTPYTTGVILFRKNLVPQKGILSGGILESRSSISGIALWAFIHKYGATGIRKIVNKSHLLRNIFREKLSGFIKPLNEFSPASSILLTLEVNESDYKVFKNLKDFFPIACHVLILDKKYHYFVKIYFFWDIKFKEIEDFFKRWEDLLKVK